MSARVILEVRCDQAGCLRMMRFFEDDLIDKEVNRTYAYRRVRPHGWMATKDGQFCPEHGEQGAPLAGDR